MEQVVFFALFGHVGKLDARAVGRQPPQNPAAALGHERIETSDRGVEDLPVQDPRRALVGRANPGT